MALATPPSSDPELIGRSAGHGHYPGTDASVASLGLLIEVVFFGVSAMRKERNRPLPPFRAIMNYPGPFFLISQPGGLHAD